MLLQGRQNKILKYVTTHLSYVVRENNEDLTKLGCDRISRSRQEVILGPREGCCNKRQDAERERKLQRRILSRQRSICCDTERRQLLSRQKNDVATRNDSFINLPSLDKGFSSCDMMTKCRYYSRSRQRLHVATRNKSRPNDSCCDKRKVVEIEKGFQR